MLLAALKALEGTDYLFKKGSQSHLWQLIPPRERVRARLDSLGRSKEEAVTDSADSSFPREALEGQQREPHWSTEAKLSQPTCPVGTDSRKHKWNSDCQQGGHGRKFGLKYQLMSLPASQKPFAPIAIDQIQVKPWQQSRRNHWEQKMVRL